MDDGHVGASCANCIYSIWIEKTKGDEQGQISHGFCRRNPPTPLLKLIQIPSKEVDALETVYQIEPSYSPTTSRQWCGEHTTVAEYTAYKAGLTADNEYDDDE